MCKKLQVIAFCFALCPFIAYAQNRVEGFVRSETQLPIANVQVSFSGSEIAVKSDSTGYFTIESKDSIYTHLIFFHPIYQSDTIAIENRKKITVVLKKLFDIAGATVKAEVGRNSHISSQTIKTEVVTSEELKKAACCDLAGCFETQGTVQAVTTNMITNSKELRILGLSGVYNQVLIDGLPLIQGLSYTYGISSIPGTLVDNIFVAKGSNSVLQGYESMVGQINVIPKSPGKGEQLLLNAYINSFGERHANFNYWFGKKKWSNLISGHIVQPSMKWDKDADGFLDLPLLKRYMVFDKIKYGDENKKGLSTMIGLRYVLEERVGGQKAYNPNTDIGSNTVYGQKTEYQQAEAYTKTAFRFNPNQRVVLLVSSLMHKQNTWFGVVNYKGNQQSIYANLQYELNWNSNHEFKAGISYRYFNLLENIAFSDTGITRTYNGEYHRIERIPGVFAENTFKWRGGIISLITGVRADLHNEFGKFFTPRAMLKYDATEMSILRASIGSGWRTANVFPENIGMMVSSRNIVFQEKLNPEQSVNWGLNYLQKFKKKNFEGFFSVDFYQTFFQNQFFPDYDKNPTLIYIENFTGTSVSNGFQTDFNSKVYRYMEFKLAYNFIDVYRIVDGNKYQLPFNSKHKLLLGLSYLSKNKKWRCDVNAHWFGTQRLPNTESNPEEYRQLKQSKPYTIFNMQITKAWKRIEIYSGCENIFDFRQIRPIVSWQNPFSQYFDTSFNWGPTRGREFYIGIRFKPNLDKPKK